MSLKNAIKQSCDIYFYELARLLGVDRTKFNSRKIWFRQTGSRSIFFK